MTVSLENLEICEELNHEIMEATRGAQRRLPSFQVQSLKGNQLYSSKGGTTGSTRSICHIDGVDDGDDASSFGLALL